MPRKPSNMFSLLRGKVRTSWNKHNLFNLYKKVDTQFDNMTLYQQKWIAKAETRAYHGEHITESRWKTEFNPKLQGVAQLDASLRGEDFETPITMQTYAVLEKRLDFVLFRSMFASSVRQARKFILQGAVEVNGVPVRHPGFPLKAGDLYSVAPERVLEALGEKKPGIKESWKVDRHQVYKFNKSITEMAKDKEASFDRMKENQRHNGSQSVLQDRLYDAVDPLNWKQLMRSIDSVDNKSILSDIIKAVKDFKGEIVNEKTFASTKYGQPLAKECMEIYKVINSNKPEVFRLSGRDLDSEMEKLLPANRGGKKSYDREITKPIKKATVSIKNSYKEQLRKDFYEKHNLSHDALSYEKQVAKWASTLKTHHPLDPLDKVQESGRYHIALPWQKGPYGRKDDSKPYFTPWKIRQFVAPFAVLPKYLEISFETCHGIYLRDPVARPGESEVITPFGEDHLKRAYMYYVRKGM